jgi:hypothetical protein
LACCLFCNLIISYSAGRQVTECVVQSLPVVEADPVEELVLGVLEGGEAAAVDELALEGRAQASALGLS